ncbi:site-2 protease family protein [Desulfomonile tiedjei]|uniref:Zinc metalloprotease n=1 Tax=Desulfomonile tiedjei (strain ATCC 49306 / DSM 6799 / DCB-1) TaxID=706587 RepID=I4C4D7_DESTA|nr:site-2 protease family protein [Desulfomonile tiedjei]AFM24428.1 Zn-dependent protease [Desulfomonile tiedjei DSM 6799]
MTSSTQESALEPTESRPSQGAIKLFKVFGITISLEYSWIVIFLLVLWSLSSGYFPFYYPGYTTLGYWIIGFFATVLFFSSIVTHELAHSLTAIRSGIEIKEITLFIFGGIAKISRESSDPQTELKIAAAGPLCSLVIALIFWVLTKIVTGGPLFAVFNYLGWINVALAVFNLVPGFPLDGGRILRALVWWRTGSLTLATKWASDIGVGFAWALMILGGLQIFTGSLVGGFWLILIGMFLRGIAAGGYQEVLMQQALRGVSVQEVMVKDVVTVPVDLPLNQIAEQYFLKYGYGGFPVVENGRPVGIINLAQLGEINNEDFHLKTVRDIMVPLDADRITSESASLVDALRKMLQTGSGRLVVMDGDRMTGMITRNGLMRFMELRSILEKAS